MRRVYTYLSQALRSGPGKSQLRAGALDTSCQGQNTSLLHPWAGHLIPLTFTLHFCKLRQLTVRPLRGQGQDPAAGGVKCLDRVSIWKCWPGLLLIWLSSPANNPMSLASFPLPQMRKMRLEEVKWLAQCHPLIREGGGSDPGCSQGRPLHQSRLMRGSASRFSPLD